MLQKLFSRTLIFALAPQVPRLANVFVLPLISPFLSSTDYYIYGTLLAYTSALSAFRDLGFGIIFPNIFFKYPHRYKIIWRQLYGYLSVWTIFYALLMGLLLFFVMPKEALPNRFMLLALLCIPPAFFENTSSIGYFFYQCREKAGYIGTVTALTGIISVVINYILISKFEMGYMAWFISLFASALLSFLMYLVPLVFKNGIIPIFIFKKSFIIPHLKVSIPAIPHYYSSWLVNSSDRVVMDRYHLDSKAIGIYNLAYTMGNYASMFALALFRAVSPTTIKLWNEKTNESKLHRRDLLFFIQTVMLLAFGIGSLWMKEVFAFLIRKPELQVAYSWAIIIVMSYTLQPLASATVIPMQFEGKTNSLWKITLVGGIINLVMNLGLLPILGVGEATVATYVAIMYTVFAGFFFKVYKEMKDVNYYPLRWLAINVLATIALYLVKDIYFGWKMGITLLVGGIGFLIIKKMRQNLAKYS